jgi:Putative transposase/Transposase zinc-binding domain
VASCAANPAACERPPLEIADVVRAHGEAFARGRPLTPEQAAALRAIAHCRTAALGGHLDVCVDCGHERPSYNSCRNRHCPKCQALAQAQWIAEREARILPTTHFHVVFTIPSELYALARFRREEVFDVLFKATARTLLDLGRQRLQAELGATMVLHTWTRDLRFHPHVHAIVTGGGLSLDGTRWIPTRQDYFMPVKQLGALFRDLFIEGLCALRRKGVFDGFEVPGGLDRLLARVSKKSWVVYAKRPFGEARHVLRYLGRYTHRAFISNQRMVSMSDDGLVTFRTKEGKTVTLTGEAFLDRFVDHVLPRHYVKIRHIGLMAASNVSTKLARARELLTGPAPTAAPVSAHAVMSWIDALLALAGVDVLRCPVCGGTVVRRPLPGGLPTPPPPDTS